ncbi:SgcJ/EcaC family oxidoreductase [Arsenophonus apicola]|uniref:SgcJ/EcaC family oxidoreductase n=1 Tax=Arsenophonus apicola TaxID=2879119 RepID=A0ABY8P1G2_9GAMM|nr:SgcJ/EcaC family oxidoreductase [Arsenophonus apicola]WGO83325.1 SgcJ/EcaC family oxidoreductase [Arsenophonus apicola]
MRKLHFLTIPLTLLSSYTFALDTAPKCIKVDQQQIASLFDRWNDSLKSGDAKKVSANYLADAVLLPTISSQVRLTDAERVDYFKHFLAKKPVGKIDNRTIRIGCNKAIDIGTYTFTFKDKSTVSARYTFTYVWDGKEWKISTHHSSEVPANK